MAATTSIPRPGVEVVQEIRTQTPNLLSPTLPGLVLSPAYEVIELYVNGALNQTKAKYEDANGESYYNFRPLELYQTDFPGGHVTPATQGRTNVAAGMVNVLEEEIRAFVDYGGVIRELAEHDTSDNTRVLKGFLIAHNVATRPFILGKVNVFAGGFTLQGQILSLSIDQVGGTYPHYLPNSGTDSVITFGPGTGAGNTHTAQDIVDQINNVLPGVAALYKLSSTVWYVALVSPSWGANARVVVRDTGASSVLGFHTLGQGDCYILGAGFRAKDDGDGDFESPLVELYRGSSRVLDASIKTGAVVGDNPTLTSPSSYNAGAIPIAAIDLTKVSGSNIRSGDEMYADGVWQGYLFSAQNTMLTMGDGPIAAAQSDMVKKELNLQTHATAPFAPRFVYFYARNLSATAESSATTASLLSAEPFNDPEPAKVQSSTDVAAPNFGLGATLVYSVTKDGAPQAERTHVLSGSGTMANLVQALNTGIGGSILCSPPLSYYNEVYASNTGDKLELQTGTPPSTPLTGLDQLLVIGNGTANVIVDPGADPNITQNETYQGLGTYHSGRTAGLLESSVDAVAGVQIAAPVEFQISAIVDNGLEEIYQVEISGDFGVSGPYGDATLDGLYNVARELNGEAAAPGTAQVLLKSITKDGVTDTSYANSRFHQQPSLVKWLFQGPDRYIRFAFTGGAGAINVGDSVTQLVSGATGTVISCDPAPAGFITIAPDSSVLFDASNSIELTGTPAVNRTGLTPTLRLALSNEQVGSSNKVKLTDVSGGIGVLGIGFVSLDEVRGTGIRPGAPLFINVDQNPVYVGAMPKLHTIQNTVKSPLLEVVFLEDLVEDINDQAGQVVASIDTTGVNPLLKLTSNKVGESSQMKIDPQGPGSGNPGYVEIWGGASITNAEMGLKYDEATALSDGLAGRGGLAEGNGRPLPDFSVTSSNPAVVAIASQILRDPTTGAPLGDARGDLYITYRGIREDITAKHKGAGFTAPLEFLDLDDLEEQLDPINDKNPAGLACRLAIANLTNIPIKFVGIDEVDEDNPDGTLDAWGRALSFLEAHRVYAMAPITQDIRIHDLVAAHVAKMSSPVSRGERVAYFNSVIPTRKYPTLINSGVDGNSSAVVNRLQVENSVISGLQRAGVSNVSYIPVATGVYLELEGTSKRWSVESAAPAGLGSIITLRTTFAAGENDDNFYTTDNLPSGLVNIDWAVYKLGVAISSADDVADAIVEQGQHFKSRRIRHLVAGSAAVNFSGTEDVITAAYLPAIYAALASQQNPQQGFTHLGIYGLTKAYGTSDTFSETQMDVIAGGGNNIIVQPITNGRIYSRHQLTTDVSSTETQEDSITRVLDYVSYFMRDSLKSFIGTFNITPSFIDQITTVIQGVLALLEQQGVIISGTLNNIVQDTADPTTLLVDITLEVPFPCNRIRLTIAI